MIVNRSSTNRANIERKPWHPAAVMYKSVSLDRTKLPTEAIRMKAALVELYRSPHLSPSGIAENSVCIKQSVPFCQIQYGGEERAAWTQRRPIAGDLQLVVVAIALGAVR